MQRLVVRRPHGFTALASIAVLTALVLGAQAPSLEPTPVEQATAQIVATLLERGHISKPTIDDAVAGRWAKNFIESLDPLKYNFLKSDVDAFMNRAETLDNGLKEGNLDFSKQVFQRFLTRSDERLEAAQKILEAKPDFTIAESIEDDPDLVDYPETAEAANDRLRKILKLDLLRLKVAETDEKEAVRRLSVRYKDLNRYYHLFDSGDLLERYLTELSESIDPHSSYMQAETLEDMLNQQLHLSLEGIGASLMIEDGFPVVKEVVPGGAADKDGRLQPEDKIVGLEGEEGNKEDFYGKKLSDIVRKIRGPAGTKVRIIVEPGDSSGLKVYELTREKIELTEQQAKGQVIELKQAEGKAYKVGVISLPSFYGDTLAVMNNDPDAVSATRDCRKLIEDFKGQGVDAVLVDLRMNGGGLLQEAITLSGLFIDKGPVVQIREAQGVKHLDDSDAGTVWDGPMAVLIDRTSASASEIFAGVIRDYGRGLIIGDTNTYGKGTVQSIVPLNERLNLRGGRNVPNLGALKLTIQQFYRPNGESTQVRGVASHVTLPSFLDVQDIGEGKSDMALKFDEVPPVPHDAYNRVPDELVANLTARSKERRAANTEFQELDAAIKRFQARKARHEISLNEKTFRDEMAANELDEEAKKSDSKKEGDKDSPEKGKENEKEKSRKRPSERVVWEDNFYNNEVMAIIADYITLGGPILTAGPLRAEEEANPPLRP